MDYKKIGICYLCGNVLLDEVDIDHVPPKQFYATIVRRKHSPNLFTLPVHRKCHEPYQIDEDYFIHSIAPLAMSSYAGGEIWKDIVGRTQRPEGNRLHEMVYREFDSNPSGLLLPDGKVVKRFNGVRVWRIVWKITRGLFFKENGRYLPEDTPRNYKIYSEGEKPASEFGYVRDTPSRGDYPGVLDYKFIQIQELNNFHLWALLFWDKLIMQVGFHDPQCSCEKCFSLNGQVV